MDTTTTRTTSSSSDAVSSAIEAQRAKAGLFFREDMAPGLVLEMTLNHIYHTSRSQFQDISVIETYFGKTLVTDGKTQSTQFDEFAYHESLVHPALLNFTSRNSSSSSTASSSSSTTYHSDAGPKTVFIGGGGELATAREVLRHKSVERCVMVDLDEKVVEVSLKHLPEWGGTAVKDDTRFELVIGDAYQYLLDCQETFDVVLMDISDPIEAGPGIMLYTKELYQHVLTRLNPGGVFVTQAGVASAIPPAHANAGDKDTTCFAPITNTLNEVFSYVIPYTQTIPSFGDDWGFVMAFNNDKMNGTSDGDSTTICKEWIMNSSDKIDTLIDGCISGGNDSLKMYDGLTHLRMFNLAKPVRKQLANDKRIMTKDNPIYMY